MSRNQSQISVTRDMEEGNPTPKNLTWIRFRDSWPKYLALCCCLPIVPVIFYSLLIAFGMLASPVVIPLLVASSLVTRLLQFVWSGDGFNKAIQLQYITGFVMLIEGFLILMGMGPVFLVVRYSPGFKHKMLVGLPLTTWVNVTCIIIGFYMLSFLMMVGTIVALPRIQIAYNDRGTYVAAAVSEIITCLIFWCAELVVMKRVPALKHHEMLGLRTQKWINVALFTVIGHNIITLSIHCVVWVLRKVCRALDPGVHSTDPVEYLIIEKLLRREAAVYWANGMKSSINFVLSSVLLLLVWVLYFRSHLNGTENVRRALAIGTMTFVSLLICSLLWSIKTCVLLALEANRVHNRLRYNILDAGKQLYFLGLLGRHKFDIFNLLYVDAHVNDFLEDLAPNEVPDVEKSASDEEDYWKRPEEKTPHDPVKKLSTRRRAKVHSELVMPNILCPTIHDVQQVAAYLLAAKNVLSQDKYASHILDYLKTNNPTSDDHGVKVEDLKRLVHHERVAQNPRIHERNLPIVLRDPSAQPSLKHFGKNDWEIFQELLKDADSSQASPNKHTATDNASHNNVLHSQNPNPSASLEEDKVSFQELQKWLETARRNCLFLANTISGDMELVDFLNTIISWLIIAATIAIWLLMTKFATTKVFVLISSPLLAVSFIFSETCKNFFQGIMFVYVMQPFDVGDECEVNQDRKMQVVSIGVWKTTFSKNEDGKQVKIIYPNSDLANKRVINRNINFDWLSEQETKKDESKGGGMNNLEGSKKKTDESGNGMTNPEGSAKQAVSDPVSGPSPPSEIHNADPQTN